MKIDRQLLLLAMVCLLGPAAGLAASPDRGCAAPAALGGARTGGSPPDSSYGFGLEVSTNRKYPLYAVGEEIDLAITVRRAAYLSVISIESDGKISELFPNKYQPDGRIEPGQTLHIPDQEHYRLIAHPPAGCSLIKIVAASRPGQRAALSRSLTDADSRLAGSDDWQETTVPIDIVE